MVKGGSSELKDRCGHMLSFKLSLQCVWDYLHVVSSLCTQQYFVASYQWVLMQKIWCGSFSEKKELEKQETLETTLNLYNLLLA